MFDFITREIDNTNVALGHLLWKAIGKKLGEEEAQFDYFDGSCIQGFGNARDQNYGKT